MKKTFRSGLAERGRSAFHWDDASVPARDAIASLPKTT